MTGSDLGIWIAELEAARSALEQAREAATRRDYLPVRDALVEVDQILERLLRGGEAERDLC